jgi:hypothetical protein
MQYTFLVNERYGERERERREGEMVEVKMSGRAIKRWRECVSFG